jgi:hypothetical protein
VFDELLLRVLLSASLKSCRIHDASQGEVVHLNAQFAHVEWNAAAVLTTLTR